MLCFSLYSQLSSNNQVTFLWSSFSHLGFKQTHTKLATNCFIKIMYISIVNACLEKHDAFIFRNKSNAKIQISFCNSAGDSNPIVTQKSCSGDSKFMLYGSEVLTTTDNVIVIYPFSNSADSAVLSVNSVLSAFHLQQMPNLRNFTIPGENILAVIFMKNC